MARTVLLASLLALLAPLAGCAPTHAQPAPSRPSTAPSNAVTRVVFLDREEVCDCTRNRAEASWRALQTALAGRNLPVERIHADTQAPAARTYLALRPMMVVPGVYFLTASGQLREMLQGDVTEAQVRTAIQ